MAIADSETVVDTDVLLAIIEAAPVGHRFEVASGFVRGGLIDPREVSDYAASRWLGA